MKHAKNPTRLQKILLESNGYDCEQWKLIHSESKNKQYVFQHDTSGDIISLPPNEF